LGSKKDRHENIGCGTIGFDILYKISHHIKLTKIPKILETPWKNGMPIYKEEISLLRHKQQK
jgi:deoxyribonuclease-4